MQLEIGKVLQTPAATAICVDAPRPLHVRVCSSWSDLEAFRAQWNHLLRTAAGVGIFSTPEWLAAWWRSYGAGKELAVLLFFAPNDELVGLAPLYSDTRKAAFGRKLRVLRLVGDGSRDSDNLDFIVRSGYEGECAKRLLSWLRDWSDWDLCVLDTLPGTSLFGESLLRHLRATDWCLLEQRSPHLFISLPHSWEGYLQRLAPEFRPLLTRYPRRLRARYKVDVYQCTRTVDLEKNLASLFSLHRKRWHERGAEGVFVNPNRRRFYQEVASTFLKRGWLEFWLMDLDGSTVAAQFCFLFGDTAYLLQEGFDPRYANEKVGYALRGEVLQDLIRRGVRRYDFLAGSDTYKFAFGAEQSSYLRIEFARPATGGSAHITLNRVDVGVKRWAHANLPVPMIRLLRRALCRADENR